MLLWKKQGSSEALLLEQQQCFWAICEMDIEIRHATEQWAGKVILGICAGSELSQC